MSAPQKHTGAQDCGSGAFATQAAGDSRSHPAVPAVRQAADLRVVDLDLAAVLLLTLLDMAEDVLDLVLDLPAVLRILMETDEAAHLVVTAEFRLQASNAGVHLRHLGVLLLEPGLDAPGDEAYADGEEGDPEEGAPGHEGEGIPVHLHVVKTCSSGRRDGSGCDTEETAEGGGDGRTIFLGHNDSFRMVMKKMGDTGFEPVTLRL